LREQGAEDDFGAVVERLLRAEAALRMAWPAMPALPGPDSGKMSPAFT
jgi:hypothetical protein